MLWKKLAVRKHLRTLFTLALSCFVLMVLSQACIGAVEPPYEEAAVEEPVQEETSPAVAHTQISAATPTVESTVPPSLPTPVSPAVPENRFLVLEWPKKIRVGDSEIIRLALEMDSEGNMTPTASVEGSQIFSEPVQIPNLYDSHYVIAEARLDMAGLEYLPSGVISEALQPGQPVIFIWSVRPREIGAYKGTVWLHLRYVPKAGGPESRKVLTAQLIEVQGVNFFGLGGTAARVLGSVGVVIGSILGLDNLLSWIWNLFARWKSLKK
jgi:hypothetical protein